MGYSYDRATNRLCCDCCGEADGTSRKRKCPAGWCPADAVCATCWAKPEVKAKLRQYHVDSECKRQAAEWAAIQARRADLAAAGIPTRSDAISIGGGMVKVGFRVGDVRTEYVMAGATYDAFPTLEPVTVEDFRKHGEVTLFVGDSAA